MTVINYLTYVFADKAELERDYYDQQSRARRMKIDPNVIDTEYEDNLVEETNRRLEEAMEVSELSSNDATDLMESTFLN